jgi:hypothetical protein
MRRNSYPPSTYASDGKQYVEYGTPEYRKAWDARTVTSYNREKDLHTARELPEVVITPRADTSFLPPRVDALPLVSNNFRSPFLPESLLFNVNSPPPISKEEIFNIKNKNINSSKNNREVSIYLPNTSLTTSEETGMKERAEVYKETYINNLISPLSELIKSSIFLPEAKAKEPLQLPLDKPESLQSMLIEEGYNLGEHGIDGNIGENTIKGLQQFLLDKGYYIGQDKFQNNGVDGKLGKYTRAAVEKFNLDNLNNNSSNNLEFYKTGFFGNIYKEDRTFAHNGLYPKITDCAAFTDHLITDFYGISTSDKMDAGVYGHAWQRERNILNAKNPGTLIFKASNNVNNLQNIAPGDIVSLRTPGGTSASGQALRQSGQYWGGQPPTHTGIVDSVVEYDENNRPYFYVVHTIYDARYRTKTYLDDKKVRNYDVVSVVRPSYSHVHKKSIPLNEGLTMASRDVKEAKNASSAVISLDFREKLTSQYGISENVALSLSIAAMGIIEQESKMGEAKKSTPIGDITLNHKEVVATIASEMKKGKLGKFPLLLTQMLEGVTGKNIPNEASRGMAQIKFNENFGDKAEYYKTVFGIDKSNIGLNIDDGSNTGKATVLILADKYNMFKEKYSEEEALYLAIQSFNRSVNTKVKGSDKNSVDFAKDFDLDYVNKVLHYSKNYDVFTEEGERIRTLIDEFNINLKVVENQNRLNLFNN